jgi:hypothetical protein
LHSWFNLLEVVFNCLALLLSPAALFIRSARSQDFVQSARLGGFRPPRFSLPASRRCADSFDRLTQGD